MAVVLARIAVSTSAAAAPILAPAVRSGLVARHGGFGLPAMVAGIGVAAADGRLSVAISGGALPMRAQFAIAGIAAGSRRVPGCSPARGLGGPAVLPGLRGVTAGG